MTTGDRTAPHFDEQAALEQLERLQQAIVDSRRRRGETIDEFDAFVRSFRSESELIAAGDMPPVTPQMPPAPRESSRPTADARPPAREMPQPVAQAFGPASVATEAATDVAPAAPILTPQNPTATPQAAISQFPKEAADPIPTAPRRRVKPATWAVIGAVGLVVLSVAMVRRGGAPANDTSLQTPATSPATQQAPAPVAPAAAPPPPAKTTGIQAELVTLRPVWIRVVADGQKTVERELKADTRLPVHAEQSIVIRAGDAGAVRVSIGGQDQGPLGRDGIVATRTFTAPAADLHRSK
jgi:hypothetical protein